MEKRHRLSISFKKEYSHIYEHLKTIPNKSDFIGKAVEAYMSGGHSAIPNEEDIRKIIMEILQNEGNLPVSPTQPLSPNHNQISDEDIDMIAQLF